MLSVTSETSADHGSLVELLGPRHPLAFIRLGDGIIGTGVAVRLEFAGPRRIADAADRWRAVVAASTVVDNVREPGSGLIAFGSFAFADESASTSVLVVPSVILGRRNGVSWVTRVTADDADVSTDGTKYPDPTPTEFTVGAMTPDGYTEAVQKALGRIAHGGLRKVVLARDLVGSATESDLRVPVMALTSAYPDTFTFAIDGLIGSSPETLVQTVAGSVSARVLAGSAARGSDPVSDTSAAATLAASRKDVEEHMIALSSVMDALRPRTSSLSASRHPFALRLPNLWHLASDIVGTLADGSSALDLVAALHPTAAVAGEPRDTALALISELEPFDRGRYAGPVGWVDGSGDGEWAIALRCAQVSGSSITAYAGAGIIAGSDPARELAETTLKFRPIVEAFG